MVDTVLFSAQMARTQRVPSELSLPVLGIVRGLVLAGKGSAGVVLRGQCDGASGERAIGIKLVDPKAANTLRDEAFARVALGEGAPLGGGYVSVAGVERAALAFRWVEGVSVEEAATRIDGRGEAKAFLDLVIRDVGAALARLHGALLRHGDVKASNLVVRLGGDGGERTFAADSGARISLIDCSLAAPFGTPLRGATPDRLPPEIRSGRDASPAGAADVYALGVTLVELAELLGCAVPKLARAAMATRPGDRPTASMLAGGSRELVPVAVAYLRTRRAQLVAHAERGFAPPVSSAGVVVGGYMQAISGLSRPASTRHSTPMPPLDLDERKELLTLVAGVEARAWTLPRELDDEEALLTALADAQKIGAITRDGLALAARAAAPEERRALADVLADVIVEGITPSLLNRLIALARTEASETSGGTTATMRATATLLRRAGRVAEARALPLDPQTYVELARLARDPIGAAAALAKVPSDLPERAALVARIALDAGDLEAAEHALQDATPPSRAEPAALLAYLRGRFDDGLRELRDGEALEPEARARQLFLEGMLRHGRGDALSALRGFGRAADIALALSAVPLEATARASMAAAAHDAGKLGDALAASERAVELLGMVARPADAARARMNRAATLLGLGARSEAIAEARRAELDARAAGDPRAERYARFIIVDAASSEAASNFGEEAAEGKADEVSSPLLTAAEWVALRASSIEAAADRSVNEGDQLFALAHARLLDIALTPDDRARAERLAGHAEPASARWTWLRACLRASETSALEGVARAPDHEAPATVVGPTLALALELARRSSRGELARSFAQRLARVHAALSPEVPVAYRAAFEGQSWVARVTQGDGDRIESLGLEGAQIDLLAAITRGLHDRTSLSDLLRQIVDGLVLWVGVERGLLLLRAPGPDGTTRLVPRVARGLSREDLRGEQLALSSSLAARALATLEPVVAVDAAGDHVGEGDLSSSIHALRLRSVLAVPLVARGEALGVVYLDDRVRRGAFGPREIAWVRLLSTQAAAAIADTRDTLRLRRLARKAERAQTRLEAHLARAEGALEVVRAQLPEKTRADFGDRRGTRHAYDAIIGDGPAIRRLLGILDRVTDAADARIPVLVQGESGTGKELVARALHDNGPRRGRAFVAENCGAIPEPLLESTLFGHVRGAFTGADRGRVGLFEIADGGTLFLDEVGEMGAAMQAKLLRVLQDGEVRPVGSERSLHVDVRVVAATHRDLEAMVAARQFREDLFYRLAVIRLHVPALRERSEDVPALVEHFMSRASSSHSSSPSSNPSPHHVRITRRALAARAAAPWPGNVRQLENELRRALVLCDETLDLEHLSAEVAAGTSRRGGELTTDLGLRDQVDALERRLLGDALRRAGGNQTRAARALGVSRFGLQKMLKRLGIERVQSS